MIYFQVPVTSRLVSAPLAATVACVVWVLINLLFYVVYPKPPLVFPSQPPAVQQADQVVSRGRTPLVHLASASYDPDLARQYTHRRQVRRLIMFVSGLVFLAVSGAAWRISSNHRPIWVLSVLVLTGLFFLVDAWWDLEIVAPEFGGHLPGGVTMIVIGAALVTFYVAVLIVAATIVHSLVSRVLHVMGKVGKPLRYLPPSG